MNRLQHVSSTATGVWKTGGEVRFTPFNAPSAEDQLPLRLQKVAAGWFRRRALPKSILRNQTNLPAFLLIALALSLLCNLALRQNTVEASRPIGTSASIEKVLNLVRHHPEDYELHAQLGKLYFQDHKYKRAMFHLAESSRLIELFGE